MYGDLDASKTLLLHGLESDFIEEQMSEDADFRYSLDGFAVNMESFFCHFMLLRQIRGLSRFWGSIQNVNYRESAAFREYNNIIFRKEVLEQKVTTILGSLNYSRKVKYKVHVCVDIFFLN